jgi:hypothetical protein
MDQLITQIVKDYHVAVKNVFGIAALIIAWVAVTGSIRFGIAIYRRKKGIYPPAASQMEEH